MKDCDDYGFSFCASGIPLRASGHNLRRLKVRKIFVRVLNTKSISINQNYIKLPNEIFSKNNPGFTGDVSVNLLGSIYNTATPTWTIHSADALPATVLSVSISGTYSV
jgi:hypothetical protein